MNNFPKNKAVQAFNDYVANYDKNNFGVALKIAHTFRVAEISEKIALSVKNIDPNFSWLLGLLHDIGRFEQVTRFGTFRDALSVDHAELGADILFHENLIEKFPVEDFKNFFTEDWRNAAEIAIRVHNKLKVPEDLPEKTKIYANILRDADKTDIFRVTTEPPYDERNIENLTVREEILQCVREHRCVLRNAVEFNAFESLIFLCSMSFEICYPKAKEIILEQGFLKKLVEQIPKNSNPISNFIYEEFIKTMRN